MDGWRDDPPGNNEIDQGGGGQEEQTKKTEINNYLNSSPLLYLEVRAIRGGGHECQITTKKILLTPPFFDAWVSNIQWIINYLMIAK